MWPSPHAGQPALWCCRTRPWLRCLANRFVLSPSTLVKWGLPTQDPSLHVEDLSTNGCLGRTEPPQGVGRAEQPHKATTLPWVRERRAKRARQ